MSLRRILELRHAPAILLLQKMLRRVPLRPFDVGRLCFLRLDHIPRIPSGLLRGPGRVRQATDSDLDGLVLLRDQAPMFQQRFVEGDHCVVAEVGGRIVGYEWFSASSIHDESSWGYRIEIPHGFVYAYDAYIDPAYRNSGIWLRFKAYLADLMINAGSLGVYTFIDYGNWPSLRTHLRFGFRPDRDVLVVKVLGRSFVRNREPRSALELADVPAP
jgi:GNAT superfamily N-acetyltransferase